MLHRMGLAGFAGLGVQQFPLVAVGAEHPHLDQFMVFERAVDFADDRWRQRSRAHHHDRFERVGTRTQRLAFGGGQRGQFLRQFEGVFHEALYFRRCRPMARLAFGVIR